MEDGSKGMVNSMHEKQNQPQNASEAAIHDYKRGTGIFEQKLPQVASTYNAFTEACFQDGRLGQKEKQLIALSIGIYSQDEMCIIYHTKGCLDNGCSEEEILEAAAVACAFGGGAAMSQAVTLVQETISELGPAH